jgi:hypothetical protein
VNHAFFKQEALLKGATAMKVPVLIQGIMRKNREDYFFEAAGIDPQDAFCEDVCHQVYPNGGEELDQCLDDCRDN